MAILVQGTLVHRATFLRAVLARASYHLTSTFLSSPCPPEAPPEPKPVAPAADVAVLELCIVKLSSEGNHRRGRCQDGCWVLYSALQPRQLTCLMQVEIATHACIVAHLNVRAWNAEL